MADSTAEASVPYGRKTQVAPAVKELHVLWITAGLGCDGDTVSITAATQPSIEDVLMGAIPGLPKVHLHNPVLAYENGDEFMKFWYQAEEGALDPFILVVEGSIPNEKIKAEGYWAALGTDKTTGQPIPTCNWIDRLAPKALGGGGGRHLRHVWRHPRDGRQPHWRHGAAGLPGLEVDLQGRHPHRLRAWLSRCSRTISWRRCCICSTRRPGWRR